MFVKINNPLQQSIPHHIWTIGSASVYLIISVLRRLHFVNWSRVLNIIDRQGRARIVIGINNEWTATFIPLNV